MNNLRLYFSLVLASSGSLTCLASVAPTPSLYSQQDLEKKLFQAIVDNDPVLFKFALEHGVNINAPLENGPTALTVAISNTRLDFVKALIRAGAQVNIPDRATQITAKRWAQAVLKQFEETHKIQPNAVKLKAAQDIATFISDAEKMVALVSSQAAGESKD